MLHVVERNMHEYIINNIVVHTIDGWFVLR